MKLYTKTGDTGESGLASGHRMSKDSLVFEVLGTLDELNAWLGYSVAMIEDAALRQDLMRIQDQLLIIGAVIAGSKKVLFDASEIHWLEKEIDQYQSQFGEDWYKKFLLPGGTEHAARIDVTRTVCRRAERLVVTWSKQEIQHPELQQYINRLSDYLFALRCFINHSMKFEETQFTPKYLEMLK
jgi:cob(I)alamin adenosyltransferase